MMDMIRYKKSHLQFDVNFNRWTCPSFGLWVGDGDINSLPVNGDSFPLLLIWFYDSLRCFSVVINSFNAGFEESVFSLDIHIGIEKCIQCFTESFDFLLIVDGTWHGLPSVAHGLFHFLFFLEEFFVQHGEYVRRHSLRRIGMGLCFPLGKLLCLKVLHFLFQLLQQFLMQLHGIPVIILDTHLKVGNTLLQHIDHTVHNLIEGT